MLRDSRWDDDLRQQRKSDLNQYYYLQNKHERFEKEYKSLQRKFETQCHTNKIWKDDAARFQQEIETLKNALDKEQQVQREVADETWKEVKKLKAEKNTWFEEYNYAEHTALELKRQLFTCQQTMINIQMVMYFFLLFLSSLFLYLYLLYRNVMRKN